MDYIKLDRKLMNWEWYGNINTCRLFIHMLLKANWKDGKFEGKVIPRGSFVSSLPKLAEETQLTVREVRTAISHLKSTREVTCKTCSKYTVFTVNNYCYYQMSDTQNDIHATGKRHSNDSQTTTIEERKNIYDDDYDIYIRAREIATELLGKHWGKSPAEIDVDRVRNLIVEYQDGNVLISEKKILLLEYAFESSSRAGVANWNYVYGIMDNLKARNIKTIDEAYEYDIANGR